LAPWALCRSPQLDEHRALGALGALPVAVRASSSWTTITPFDAPPRDDHAAATLLRRCGLVARSRTPRATRWTDGRPLRGRAAAVRQL